MRTKIVGLRAISASGRVYETPVGRHARTLSGTIEVLLSHVDHYRPNGQSDHPFVWDVGFVSLGHDDEDDSDLIDGSIRRTFLRNGVVWVRMPLFPHQMAYLVRNELEIPDAEKVVRSLLSDMSIYPSWSWSKDAVHDTLVFPDVDAGD